MSALRHQAILASAGSGKTYRLAHRYIELIALGVEPERICALTFSRKAAGEIFESIVEHMAGAAAGGKKTKAVADQIRRPELKAGDFQVLLKQFLRAMHRLTIGTLDSFTVGILRAFPLETGIPMTFQLSDGQGGLAMETRAKILGRLFNPNIVAPGDQDHFLEAFKQATFGKEEKLIQQTLDRFIECNRAHYQALPHGNMWGDPDTIWKTASVFLAESENEKDLDKAAHELLRAVGRKDWAGDVREKLSDLAFYCAHYTEQTIPDTKILGGALPGRLLGDCLKMADAPYSFKFRKSSYYLEKDEAHLLYRLLKHLVAQEIRRNLRVTQGIYRVLDQYETYYDRHLRSTGMLTFEDAQYLLTDANEYSGGAKISRTAGAMNRLYIDYRLNARLDHWLIDEFQDTNDLQWSVIGNLIDEILQDAEGARSFFYVGDIKQAIYGWRGGNARLFSAVMDRYPSIEPVRMNCSYRSCPEVIQTVNRIFSDLPGDRLRPDAVTQWNRIWGEHTWAEGFVPESGYCALLEPVIPAERKKPVNEDYYTAAANLLKTVQPVRRGFSCALLMRSNDGAKALHQVLLAECPDMPIALEGKSLIRDNPSVELLLSLVRLAEHPGDNMVWRHVQMSPLYPPLKALALDRDGIAQHLLDHIYSEGFEGCIRRWTACLADAVELTLFESERLEHLAQAAAEFDQAHAPDVRLFLSHIDHYSRTETGGHTMVRIMTVHQAKGLEFDMVILPELMAGGMAAGSALGLVIARDPETAEPRWALNMPNKVFRECDEVLEGEAERIFSEHCFEALCVLYVAATRAKRALYFLTGDPGGTFSSGALVRQQLAGEEPTVKAYGLMPDQMGVLFETGDAQWYSSGKEAEAKAAPEPIPAFELPAPEKERVAPSKAAEEERKPSPFAKIGPGADDLGTAVHLLFEQVEWWTEDAADNAVKAAQKLLRPDVADMAVKHFRRAMEMPDIRDALKPPDGPAELWREKRYEIIMDGHWHSGSFDRVVLYLDNKGKAERAEIIDFKTGGKNAEHYHPQLELYRKALAQITGLDEKKIEPRILFTGSGD